MSGWKVYSDNFLLYSSSLDDYQLVAPSLDLELNKTGSFKFTIYPDHPNYGQIKKLKSIITVYRDNQLYFRGRVLNDTLGFHNERQVLCEGELAFLLDSVQRPFSFPLAEGTAATVAAYFAFLIERHNTQVAAAHQFVVGEVTVTDPNNYLARSDTEFSNTWTLLSDLLDTYGGYLVVDADENGNRRINYYADLDLLLDQPVEFGLNLLDIQTERKGEDIATAIIPLGKKDETTGERLTISGIPDEETSDFCKSGDMVYSKAAETEYDSRITRVVVWDDVTIAGNLLTKAREQLGAAIQLPQYIELTSADISAAGYNFGGFRLGRQVNVTSEPHGLNKKFLVHKLSIKLLDPAANKLSLGRTISSFSEEAVTKGTVSGMATQIAQAQSTASSALNDVGALRETVVEQELSIISTCESMILTATEKYVETGDFEEYRETIAGELKVMAGEISGSVTRLTEQIENVEGDLQNKYDEITKYFTFDINGLTIGQVDNPNKVIIDNDEIIIQVNGAPVQRFDSNGTALIPELNVTQAFDLLGYIVDQDGNGNVNCEYVGG